MHQRCVAQWRHHQRVEPLGETAKGSQVAVIVVVVAEKYDRDFRKVVEGNAGIAHSARTQELKWASALRVLRVSQHAAGGALDQERRVADERDGKIPRARQLHGLTDDPGDMTR